MGTSDGTILSATKIVDNGPNSSRFNLVIMGDGYQSGQMTQFAQNAQSFVNALFAAAPFDSLRTAINVHRIDVTSTDSGADDPAGCGGPGTTARTYFDAAFCNNGIRRLLVVSSGTAITVADARVPEHHAIVVIVNSTVYGGSGGSVACFSLASGANEIALHEMGHSAFGLADEYEYYAGCGVDTDRNNHPAAEPAEANVTVNSNRDTIKWRELIAAATPMPTTRNANCSNCDPQPNPVATATVGAFEGAHYYHCGAFRAQFTCRMRALSNPFCAVCQRRIRDVLRPFEPVRPVIAVPGWFGAEDQGADIALADISGNGINDLLVLHIDNPGGENHGYYRIGWNLDADGRPTGGWSPVRAIPGWFGAEDQGAGVAIADINGNGRPDLVVFHIDNPGGENHGYYRIGWNLDTAGNVTGGWSPVIPVPGWFGAEDQGAGIAIADISGNGRPDLVVFHIDNPGGENHGYYRIGWNLDTAGNVTGGWSPVIAVPGWFGAEDQGGGMAVADLDHDGRPELVVFHLDNPGGENHGYYRIGRKLDTAGHVTGGWGPITVIPGWFGAEDQGAGIAIGRLGTGTAFSLVVFHVDNPGGENHGYYRTIAL